MYQFLKTERKFSPNEIICALGNTPCQPNNPKRIQINEQVFILPPVIISHSCDPNAYIDWKTMELRAKKPIALGDTITYHYETSEYDYTIGAFSCACGALSCLGTFRGCKYMSNKQREAIREYLSPYLLRKISKILSKVNILLPA